MFNLQQRCLVGIVSRKIVENRIERLSGKIQIQDIGKYFVPAPEIAAFLPEGVL